jgi:hypothetical protein
MVIVYSGDSVRVPDWSAGSERPPSEPPPSEAPSSGLPASEPLPPAGELEEQSPASAGSGEIQPPEGTGWHEPELGSGSRPVLPLGGDDSPGPADRLTPLGPPWSEPAPPLPVAAPARAKVTSRSHLWTAALSGSALLAIGYFAFSAAEPERPLVAESVRPEPKLEQAKAQPQPQPAPPLPAVSAVASPPSARAVDARAGAPAPAPAAARPAAAGKAAPSKAASAPDAASGSTRVRLEVIPTDAQVGRRGFTQKGPPYFFEVPKGKRVELEVVRKGYVTRKVTLDGRSSRVVVGLAKARSVKR